MMQLFMGFSASAGASPATVWALVVGGGGRGGTGLGDGGNGGVVVENASLSVPVGTHTITPGIAGTVGGAANGTACSIGALISASGGAAGGSNVFPGRYSAAGVGAGTGVNGVSSSISGTSIVYGSGGSGGTIFNIAFENDDVTGPAGGSGGGVNLGGGAATNRGGGGCGGYRDNDSNQGSFFNSNGGNGANGPAVVRFPTANAARFSHTNATVTTSGSDTIYTWTVAGTLTVI